MPTLKTAATINGLVVFDGPYPEANAQLSNAFVDWVKGHGVECEYVSFQTFEAKAQEIYATLTSIGLIDGDDQPSVGIMERFVSALLRARFVRQVIVPALASQKLIVTDHFLWPTVELREDFVSPLADIKELADLERRVWADIRPRAAVFLTSAPEGNSRPESANQSGARRTIAQLERNRRRGRATAIHWISSLNALDGLFEKVLQDCRPTARTANRLDRTALLSQPALWPSESRHQAAPSGNSRTTASELPQPRPALSHSVRQWRPAEPTEVFDTYWRFAVERQTIFLRRLLGEAPPWTQDSVLQTYKFTNAYRASDRVSQYLIRQVIYDGHERQRSVEDTFFRIMLFKVFNRIDTWQLLERTHGSVALADYTFDHYDQTLTKAMDQGLRIFSAAYIMPSGSGQFGHARKHRNYLRLIEQMLLADLPARIQQAGSMRDAFQLIRDYPLMGDFLAYQYITDLNYSEMIDYSEMEFVVPGPGAQDGIRKCFRGLGGLNPADIIQRVAKRQQEEFESRGLVFPGLFGRPLQLIDCQNLFCEVDKYARVVHPDVTGKSGRTRIKQSYRETSQPVHYWYPPKWGINDRIAAMLPHGSREHPEST